MCVCVCVFACMCVFVCICVQLGVSGISKLGEGVNWLPFNIKKLTLDLEAYFGLIIFPGGLKPSHQNLACLDSKASPIV